MNRNAEVNENFDSRGGGGRNSRSIEIEGKNGGSRFDEETNIESKREMFRVTRERKWF